MLDDIYHFNETTIQNYVFFIYTWMNEWNVTVTKHKYTLPNILYTYFMNKKKKETSSVYRQINFNEHWKQIN